MGISRKQALDCFRSDDLVGIGMEADAVRRRLHPEGVVSYVVGCTIDYTSVAAIGERTRGFAAICERVGTALDAGGTYVTLRGRPDAGAGIGWFEGLFAAVKGEFPEVWLEALGTPELLTTAASSTLSLRDTVLRLRDAGLDGFSGHGAGDGCGLAEWVEVHRIAHGLGMRTTAAAGFGGSETADELIDQMEAILRLQEETGGFLAFVPMSFRPAGLAGGRELDEATAVESLKTLAIARMVLDNIHNVQADGATQSLKVLQMALRFGANDAGTVRLGGGDSEEDVRRVIRDAGFRPVQRDAAYRTVFLN